MNTYQAPIRCTICGDGEISSSEGTTQGDPLAMAMYALAVKPLIGKLQYLAPAVKQVWYADDATGAGTCDDLRTFWNSVQIHGTGYGYHPNGAKTHIVVMLRRLGINVTTEDKHHLGAAIGSRSYTVPTR